MQSSATTGGTTAAGPDPAEASVDIDEFALPGGRVGCLLIHGFSGTPYEMRYLGDRLHARGCSVRGVRLSGHAVHGRELFRSSRRDWLSSARAGFDELSRGCETVVIAGISMGALLAVQLAHERPERVHGLVLLAPALQIANRRVGRYAPLLRAIVPLLPDRWQTMDKDGSDICDPVARQRHPRFPIPLRGLAELAGLQRAVRPLLPHIAQPVLILHGRLDRICPVSSSEMLRAELGSRRVRFRILEESAHVVTVDAERDVVAREVEQFVAELSAEIGGAKPVF
jgi:carboxylesterase